MTPSFTQLLLKWHKHHNFRPMPWKGEKDPYKIWLSEIILQQTRVEQGWPYYEKMIAAFPTIHDLAKANQQKVFKLWEGLGYYRRCTNLQLTAKYISEKLNGQFPDHYEGLLALKGVGPYTASAIASFAYNLPYAVVDGNVFRVFSRYYGMHTPIDTKEGIALYNQIATENLSKKQAGIYNQAIMDFGATICKPLAPNCASCLMQKTCVAHLNNQVNQLPIKLNRIQRKKRYFDFLCFHHNGKWLIQKRGDADIWDGLYQFYLMEQSSHAPITANYLNEILNQQLGVNQKKINDILSNPTTLKNILSNSFTQTLTHQLIHARFIHIPCDQVPTIFSKAIWVNPKQMKQLAFPKIINEFLDSLFINWSKT